MRRARAAVALACAWVALAACSDAPVALPTPGQLVVYVDTDAIVPRGQAGPYGPLEPYPLFDHVRFDVVVPGVDCDCTRDFEIDETKINAGAVSFGIASSPAKAASTGTIRVRLFRYADTDAGEPRAETTIDATYALDPIPAEGASARTVFLRTEDVGRPLGADSPLIMSEGRPAEFHAGTWAGGARVDCASPPRAGEVCVPGGAFWMGSPLEARRGVQSGAQRLAVVSPFFLGATEVTVAAFRGSGLRVTPWSGLFNDSWKSSCTFTAEPGRFEDHPVNCVAPSVARTYCRRQGADLPTEAQLEYAQGALQSAPYVWGTDPPTCEAVTMCQGNLAYPSDMTCRAPGEIGGPAKVGSGLLDRLPLSTGTIVDLIGNVGEIARDLWARLDEPCWSRPGLYVDPVCTRPGAFDPSPSNAVRGGSWVATPNRASGRMYAFGESGMNGFRCARSAGP